MSLESVLNEIEHKSFSLRDKGTKFEVLIKNWFLTTRLYCDNIDKIWLWDEFPYKDQFGGSDSGIDLVILTKESEFIAVQCKFYSSTASIDKADVDTFISTSAKIFEHDGEKTKFSGRLFISTTNNWSKKADELIQNQEIPVNRISLSTLRDSGVDWNKLYAGMIGTKARQEKKTIRDHQQNALKKVNEHFKSADRGKLIMACGTGKTFTSLKIAENETNGNGLILFLVPSIALLGQTLREWTNDVSEEFYPICICSDPKISRTSSNDDNGMSVVDLALPATTNVDKIVEQLENIKKQKGLKVVFSTYQSIDVILDAQKQLMAKDPEFGTFDLVICDEAHRTTGVTLPGEEESNFTKIHNNEFIKAKKRLYMTATPRLYDDNSKSKAEQNKAYLCSMDDRSIYGDEIYRIGFGEAVERGLLTDYKVLILTLNHSQVPKEIQALIANEEIEFKIDDASKLMGCINGLSKQILDKEGIVKSSDPDPMKRAVAFCRDIKTSKKITSDLNEFSDTYISSLKPEVQDKMVEVSSKHIDGSMNALQREELLSWLKEDSDNSKECKILTNARCLSEGVDVPTLDAVLFLSAKNSQVDVVQSVGRVMRRAPGKKYGYIIIPVVIPASKKPEEALNDNDTYKVVWSVLNALRAHDDRFNAEVNKIDLNKRKPKNILIGTVDNTGKEKKYKDNNFGINEDQQMKLDMDVNKLQNAIYAKMVEKVGDRKYFETWAKDVAQIAEIQIDKIRDLIKRDKEYKKAFDKFIAGLQSNISPDIDTEQGIEMLSQHIITRPIFEALFEGYSFVNSNPISRSMQDILDLLLKGQIEKETEELNNFYKDVKLKIGDIDNAEGKQKIIVELYDKFFRTAFPKLVDQLGIVYTPVEVVDFIINSVEVILQNEFDRSITDENVNVLDPFTGTGTFISRLLQSGLIKNKDLQRKYSSEIFANEIVLLAYYIATVNIENVYHDLQRKHISTDIGYSEFNGICLTDTFQLGEDDQEIQMFDLSFKENSERVNRQKKAPLQVIIGNPPYSVGQKSEDDNAQNKEYPKLDTKIANTYVVNSNSKTNKALYDTYIKAFRWATDRLDKTGGIIGFVTNGSWLDGGASSGFRKVIGKEFTSIYVFNLRGNARTSGEERRKEKGNVFGSGSRTPIAITFLVKNPNIEKDDAKIYYHDIGDYLSKEEKLEIISEFKSVQNINWKIIKPNNDGDWINKRSKKFKEFISLYSEKNVQSFFSLSSIGVVTSRDAWVYSYSKTDLQNQMTNTIGFYNKQLNKIKKAKDINKNVDINDIIEQNLSMISWSNSLKSYANRLLSSNYDSNKIKISSYRPFNCEYLYFDNIWNHRQAKWEDINDEITLVTSGVSASKPFSVLITNHIANNHYLDTAKCYPLYYDEKDSSKTLFGKSNNRKEAITDFIHNLAKEKYGVPRISKEDIFYYVYGFLHNEDYRKEFEADLKKEIPRLPLVDDYEDFKSYSNIGRELADLHLNYEKLDRPKEVIVEGEETGNYEVKKMKFIKKGKQDTIIYNKDIKIKNIPLTAYEYQVNGKSAIEWIMERYQVKIDNKSKIKDDPNLWCQEHKDPKYILNLLLSIITLSLKTNELVKKLPKVEF